ncbi:MAG: CopG family transcriptional regulator [Vicinamibacterales bacterium]
MRRLKNLTITLEDSVARWARLEAARENTSVSRFVGELLSERMRHDQEYDAAMERYLSVKPRAISKGQPYPRREELHDRADLR